MAASNRVTPKSLGAKINIPTISKQAGIKDNNIAGRPTFLNLQYRGSTLLE
jgi:hypothetical protein